MNRILVAYSMRGDKILVRRCNLQRLCHYNAIAGWREPLDASELFGLPIWVPRR